MLRGVDPTERKPTLDLEQRAITSILETKTTSHNGDYLSRVFEGVSKEFAKSIDSQSLFKVVSNSLRLRTLSQNSKLRTLNNINELDQLTSKAGPVLAFHLTVFQIPLNKLVDSCPVPSKQIQGPSLIQTDLDRSPWASKRRRLQASSGRSEMEIEDDSNGRIVDSLAAVDRDCSFKTAREKLQEDHLKKAAGSKDNQNTCYKAPFLKKKLNPGGGARGKFVAPFNKDSSSGAASAEKAKSSILSTRTLDLLTDAHGDIPEALKLFDLALVEAVCSEILQSGDSVQWKDIAGQETAKQLVQEMVGARTPPRGLLLFGPPGTGKTLIGRAIASNIKATFFNISASSLTSKWIGEGEKMVRILFAVAEVLQPTVIFIDEIDSILSCRKSDGEHESSRRIKTELLIQMDGCNPNSTTSRILIVGATNRPQELDEAARRRMPKQLYIPLPCPDARRQLVLSLLGNIKYNLDPEAIDKIVRNTEGYSGADMKNLIQEACQGPIREQFKDNGADITTVSEDALRAVNLRDFRNAAKAQKASVGEKEIEHYIIYNEQYGAKIAMEESDDENW